MRFASGSTSWRAPSDRSLTQRHVDREPFWGAAMMTTMTALPAPMLATNGRPCDVPSGWCVEPKLDRWREWSASAPPMPRPHPPWPGGRHRYQRSHGTCRAGYRRRPRRRDQRRCRPTGGLPRPRRRPVRTPPCGRCTGQLRRLRRVAGGRHRSARPAAARTSPPARPPRRARRPQRAAGRAHLSRRRHRGGPRLLRDARRRGVVAKHCDATTYRPGARSTGWRRIKCSGGETHRARRLAHVESRELLGGSRR